MAELDDLRLQIKRLERSLLLLTQKISLMKQPAEKSWTSIQDFVKRQLDHGELKGLADDDHSQYLLLAGRAGGQVAVGGTGSGDDLTLQTTSHVTKGSYILSELTTVGYVKTDASGVLSSTASLVIPIYSQDDEPDIPNNTIALWIDTDGSPDYYLVADFGGTQKKVALT
jgi:hypothetical protein